MDKCTDGKAPYKLPEACCNECSKLKHWCCIETCYDTFAMYFVQDTWSPCRRVIFSLMAHLLVLRSKRNLTHGESGQTGLLVVDRVVGEGKVAWGNVRTRTWPSFTAPERRFRSESATHTNVQVREHKYITTHWFESIQILSSWRRLDRLVWMDILQHNLRFWNTDQSSVLHQPCSHVWREWLWGWS